MSVKVQNLTRLYGEQRAVDNISFNIQPGEIVGFLGPNGAGKSTTMKMLTCYITPTSGDAWVYGKSIADETLEVRRKIGYLPEHNPLYLDMYVKEYLRFVAGVHGVKNNVGKRIEKLVALTGLGLEQHKKIGMLSKGYRQRVGLAQALLHDPEVLVLDEPTSGLDPNQIVEIRNLIKEVGKSKTIILSTHILQEVQAMCNRVIIINRGKIVADSPTERLMQRFAGQNFYRVSFKHPVSVSALKALEGVEEVRQEVDEYVLRAAGNRDIRDALFNYAMSQNNPIYGLEKESQSLETVFQQLTKTNTNKVKA